MKTYAEKVNWDEFKKDIKAPEKDNNEGYIFGLFFTDHENEGDIYECVWYKTDEERTKAIKEEKITIINP